MYVADLYNHRIQKFDSAGNFLTKWGSFGSGDGQFDRPYGAAVDLSGNVFVADMGNNRIQKFAEAVEKIEVEIDIKPGSDPNSINPRSKGVIPVAILTTETFDATTVDPLSVAFGPNGAIETHGQGHIEDADGDGDLDLVLHFNTQDTGIQCGDTTASLTGETLSGQTINGSDSINTVGCK